MNNEEFDFSLFIKESVNLLVNPKGAFSSMKTSGGLAEPLIKALIYGFISGIIAVIWSLLRIGIMSGGFYGGSSATMFFVSEIGGSIIGLFLGGLILLVISSICKGNTDFEANIRVLASVWVLMPVATFLRFTGAISPFLGSLVNLGISIFSLWLLYNGLVEALKTKPETTRIVMYIFAALMVLIMIVSMG